MKNLFRTVIFSILIIGFSSTVQAQIKTEERTEEYATVRLIVSTETGNLAESTTLTNPYLEMEATSMELKNYIKDPQGAKFSNVTEILNYMNSFGWTLISNYAVPVSTDTSSNYVVNYTFKRKPKK